MTGSKCCIVLSPSLVQCCGGFCAIKSENNKIIIGRLLCLPTENRNCAEIVRI